MKYIDADLLRKEIERRMDKHWDLLPNADSPEDDWTHNELCELGAYKELEHLEDFLDSLQEQEHPIYQLNQILLDWVREAKTDKEQEARFEAHKRFFELYDEYMVQGPEQPVLPGIDEEGIPGRDFIPVEWVDACEKYGKWKIVQQEQPEKKEVKFVFPKFLYARTTNNKTIDVSYAPQSLDAVEYIRSDSLQQEQPEVDLEKFTEKIKTFQRRYKYPEIVSIKGAMAFMARMFYQYPNAARQWYDSLPKVTMD